MKLKDEKCINYKKGMRPMVEQKIHILSQQISRKWDIIDGIMLKREFEFNNFIDGIRFVDNLAIAAEEKKHHPDIDIRYNKIIASLSTHNVGGLTMNDFIMAAKIDDIMTQASN